MIFNFFQKWLIVDNFVQKNLFSDFFTLISCKSEIVGLCNKLIINQKHC